MVSFLFPRYDWLQSLHKSISGHGWALKWGRQKHRSFLGGFPNASPAFPGAQDPLQGRNREALSCEALSAACSGRQFIPLYILMSESQKLHHSTAIPPWAWFEVCANPAGWREELLRESSAPSLLQSSFWCCSEQRKNQILQLLGEKTTRSLESVLLRVATEMK